MVTDQKRQIALFRYGIISDFVNRTQILNHGEKEKLLRSKYNCTWHIQYFKKSSISRGTILYWIGLFIKSNGKIESLYPQRRSDKGISRAIDIQTANNLINLAKEYF